MDKAYRLDKILSDLGYGTRREIKTKIKKMDIRINGIITKNPATHVNPFVETIEVNREILKYKNKVYIMMNKPAGIISATHDDREKTVIDILPETYKKRSIFPVGRLHKDTEGLLLLTDDGKLAHEMLSPKKHVKKKYYAEIVGIIPDNAVELFKEGVTLEDEYKTLPADLRIIQLDEVSRVEVIIYEGKYHQIKRMFKAIDCKVVFLKRLTMGILELDGKLCPGEFRELSEDEEDKLLETYFS